MREVRSARASTAIGMTAARRHSPTRARRESHVAHLHRSRTARALTATYRLQLNGAFTLHDARARVPYLHALGVSHLYCSPVLAARAGSTHGYDVADPTQVNPELGGDAAFVALAEAAHAHGMGLVLDIVPNHMGIGAGQSVLGRPAARTGRRRGTPRWFDVEWRAETRRLANKVLLPVLGDSLDAVLERGELTLEVTGLGRARALLRSSLPDRSGDVSAGARARAARSVGAARGARVERRGGGARADARAARAAALRARLLARGEPRHQLPPLLRRQRADRAQGGGRRGVRRDARDGAAVRGGRARGRAAHRSHRRTARAAALPRAAARGGGRAPARAAATRGSRSSWRRSSRRARRCPPTGRWTARRATSS